MKATMNLLRVILFVLLLGGVGCAPEATELDTPEEMTPPVAQLVIKLVEDGTALELTLTNTGDVELFTDLYGDYHGFELILKDASGESFVPLEKERRRRDHARRTRSRRPERRNATRRLTTHAQPAQTGLQKKVRHG